MIQTIPITKEWVTNRIAQQDMLSLAAAAKHIDIPVNEMRERLENKHILGVRISPNMWMVPKWQFDYAFLGIVERCFEVLSEHLQVLAFLETPLAEHSNMTPNELAYGGKLIELLEHLEKNR